MMHLAFCAPTPSILRGAWSRSLICVRVRRPGRPYRASTIRASSTTVQPPTPVSSKSSYPEANACKEAAPTFQDAVRVLQDYWAAKGCLIWHPCNTEVGAGTMNPATFLRVLGPEPWSVAYEEPSLRPDDSRYGENPNRLQRHTQFQVIVKPAPECAQELVLGSYRALGIDLCKHDVRFVEDNWQSPALGAWGLGWEVWLDGMEVTQFTYFQQAGGIALQNVAVEVTYGLERIIMSLQGKAHFKDILFAPGITYGEIFMQNEFEMSVYNLKHADMSRNTLLFDEFEAEAKQLLEKRLPVPAYGYLLKASHTFNILDARGAVGVTERARFFQRMRNLAREVATLWLDRREELKFPLLSPVDQPKNTLLSTTASSSVSSPRPLKEQEQFVLEIGLEELPPADLDSMVAQVKSLFTTLFDDSLLRFDSITVTGTPRRVAVMVKNLQTRQEDTKLRVRGPPLRAALDKDGNPTRAAVGFLKKQGISDIKLGEFDEQEGYMYATVERKGKSVVEVLATGVPEDVLCKISFAKTMRWNETGVAFSRPVRWLLCMVGEHQVPFQFSGVSAGALSRSLRGSDGFASSIAVNSADEYETEMKKNQIMLPKERRRYVISAESAKLVSEIGGTLLMDEGLLEEVANLVENPISILGRFDPTFLALPDDVLITVMKKHQRYFPVTDARTGDLLNAFITVANGDADLVDLDAIRAGNEAVLRARYADASFFYENDTKDRRLADFVPLLDTLAFQESLGSMLDKTNRVCKIVPVLGKSIGLSAAELEVAESAAKLAKADLATSMVIEMTSLAGVMGKHYAQKSGEVSPAVSDAIFDAALPRFSGDKLPKSLPGAVVGISDRLDSLLSLFGIGLAPKATADPFALRRAALGIVQIMIEKEINTNLSDLIAIADISPTSNVKNREEVLSFIEKRLEAFLLEGSGTTLRPDVIKAVLAVPRNARNPFVAYQTAVSLQRALASEMEIVKDAADTHSRAARLLKSIGASNVTTLAGRSVDANLFETVEESNLLKGLMLVQASVKSPEVDLMERLRKVASLKTTVDEFFDKVFVNAEEEQIRWNRQALSAQIVKLTEDCLDLTLLQL